MPAPANKFGYILPENRSWGVEREHMRVMQDAPLMSAAGRPIAGTGAGKTVVLTTVFQQVAGHWMDGRQTAPDCVSWGTSKAYGVAMAVDIAIRGDAEEWPGYDPATEWNYGTSRILVGKGRLGASGGSVGSWAAKALIEHGMLFRKKYSDKVDLTRYSGKRAEDWGYRGLPYDMEPEADQHPISQSAALVTSYEQARDAIANGYPVTVCSNYGFGSQRDSQGFCRKSGSWAHCMLFCGCDDTSRPGLYLDNSWGRDYTKGPTRLGTPTTGWWVDADTADKMLRQEDSWAIPGVNGFARQAIDWSIT